MFARGTLCRLVVGVALGILLLIAVAPIAPAKTVITHSEHDFGGELIKTREAQRDAFYKKYGTDIEIQFIPTSTNWDEYLQKLTLMATTGDFPDVWHPILDGGRVLLSQHHDKIADLTDLIKRDKIQLAGLRDPSLRGYVKNGRIYGLPHVWATWVVQERAWIVNKTMFADVGLQIPAMTWTWTDVYQAARKLSRDSNGDGKKDKFGTIMRAYEETPQPWPGIYWAMLYGYGLDVGTDGRPGFIRSDFTGTDVNKPVAVEALNLLKAIVDVDQGIGASALWNEWGRGNLGMLFADWGGVQGIANMDVNFDIKLLPMPGGPVRVFRIGSFYEDPDYDLPELKLVEAKEGSERWIVKEGAKKEAAWKWLKFILFDPAAVAAMKGRSYQPGPITEDLLDDYYKVVTDRLVKAGYGDLQKFWLDPKNAAPFPKKTDLIMTGPSPIPWAESATFAQIEPMGQFLMGKISAKQALELIEERINAVLKKYDKQINAVRMTKAKYIAKLKADAGK